MSGPTNHGSTLPHTSAGHARVSQSAKPQNATASSSRRPEGPTVAEAYASAHHPRREKVPILEWLSRKLAGRRATVSEAVPPRARQIPLQNIHGPPSTHPVSLNESDGQSVLSHQRILNNPYPSIPVPPRQRPSTLDSESRAPSTSILSRSRSPSETSIGSHLRIRYSIPDDGSSLRHMWADEDASVRPIPPSHPSSPTPSQSLVSRNPLPRPSSPRGRYSAGSTGLDPSVLSFDPDEAGGGESRRDSASTKPTTILSFDSGANIGRIASHPPAQLTQQASTAANLQLASPVLLDSPSSSSVESPSNPHPAISIQAPRHSQPHPRDNPNPAAPPGANSSTLTLASSTFAMHQTYTGALSPSIRTNANRSLHRPLATSPSVTFATHDADYAPSGLSASFRTGGWGPSAGGGRADRDASVRAVRRKGSWESNESGWSWRSQGAGAANADTAASTKGGKARNWSWAEEPSHGGHGYGTVPPPANLAKTLDTDVYDSHNHAKWDSHALATSRMSSISAGSTDQAMSGHHLAATAA